MPDFATNDEMDVQKAEVYPGDLAKAVRHIEGTTGQATLIPPVGEVNSIAAHLGRSRGKRQVRLKIGIRWVSDGGGCCVICATKKKSQIMSMSGLLEESRLVQYNIDFCGCGIGFLPITLHAIGDVPRTECKDEAE